MDNARHFSAVATDPLTSTVCFIFHRVTKPFPQVNQPPHPAARIRAHPVDRASQFQSTVSTKRPSKMGSFFQNEPICKRRCKRHKFLYLNSIHRKLRENKMGSFREMAHFFRPCAVVARASRPCLPPAVAEMCNGALPLWRRLRSGFSYLVWLRLCLA